MFKVLEITTGTVLIEVSTIDEASSYISNIESSDLFAELLNKYGSARRIQQELVIIAE